MNAVVELKQPNDGEQSPSERWLAAYLEHGDALKAVDDAGYQCSTPHSRRCTAYRLKKRHADAILDDARQKIKEFAPIAIKQLGELALNSEQDSVKATASKALCSYAGLDVQITEHRQDSRTDEQLIDAIAQSCKSNPAMRDRLLQALKQ